MITRLRQWILYGAVVCVAIIGTLPARMGAQGMGVEANTSVGAGWHPWYEIKANPENPKNLIICGTKWDALRNAPFGLVYASSDGGANWEMVLEDRNSAWVTEHSCAFGSRNRVYFISEAATVLDGHTETQSGTTRLYVSTDAGKHWVETVKTAWADHSASALSTATGKLYTFFNANTNVPGKKWGSSVGLLVFSPEGTTVGGPFVNSEMKTLGYEGVYPWQAITLRSGAVAALYWGTRQNAAAREADLGVIRADQSPEPELTYTTLSNTRMGKDCLNFDQGSLAYDAAGNRLFAVYVDGCEDTRIMLTSSEDEGRTWAKSVVVAVRQNSDRRVANPSIVAEPGGVLAFLWEEGQASGQWLFSRIRDQELIEPATVLSLGPANWQISNDSLWTWIYQPNRPQGSDPDTPSEPSITLNVRAELNNVWRGNGLITAGDKTIAVWPSGDGNGMRLYSGVLSRVRSPLSAGSFPEVQGTGEADVTEQTVILYGGTQHFDSTTGTLKVCLVLANRGPKAIEVPIRLRAEDIKSPTGAISIVDSTNGLTGVGAVWDISHSVAGGRIPARANSNSFCLSFHTRIAPRTASLPEEEDLLILKLRVLASDVTSWQDQEEEKRRSKPVER